MPYDQAVTINMDQEVTLTVCVSVGERYTNRETLSQDLTAPLFVIKNVEVKAIADTLCKRVLQIYMTKLREKESRRMDEEQLQEAYDQEQETEGEVIP